MLGLDFITRNFFGNLNERKLKPYAKRVERINALEPEFEQLTDEQLKAKTDFFKQQYAEGHSLDDLLEPAFATTILIDSFCKIHLDSLSLCFAHRFSLLNG